MSQSSKRGFFITGTDTEVGKTLIASALILKIKSLVPNQTVMGFKPVVAGTSQSPDGHAICIRGHESPCGLDGGGRRGRLFAANQ